MKLKGISWLLLLLPFSICANDDVLSIDRAVPSGIELAFPNESNIQPDLSDFSVQHFALMSNERGERWAVVTVKNEAQGGRNLSHKHLMALVADGNRILPTELSQSFKAGETLTLTISFGESQFPLLSVYSRVN